MLTRIEIHPNVAKMKSRRMYGQDQSLRRK